MALPGRAGTQKAVSPQSGRWRSSGKRVRTAPIFSTSSSRFRGDIRRIAASIRASAPAAHMSARVSLGCRR